MKSITPERVCQRRLTLFTEQRHWSLGNTEGATSMSRVRAFSQKGLFLERFWRQFRISFGSHKPLSQTKRPENDV